MSEDIGAFGAQPAGDKEKEKENGETPLRIGAETVFLKMQTSEGEDIEVSLLNVINQLFIDMGHFDMRVRTLEGGEPETDNPLIKL